MTLVEELRQQLVKQIDITREVADTEILEIIDELILERSRMQYLTLADKDRLRQEVFYSIRKLDVLQELIDNDSITEIMVNGWNRIYIEQEGRTRLWEKSFTSEEKLYDVMNQIVAKCNRVINAAKPIVDARLENGSRVHAVIAPVALNGPILTIRRFPDKPITLNRLVQLGSITKEAADFLTALTAGRYSILIGGSTGTGKSTFLGALSQYIPKDERIITIEDNAELQIQGVDNLVRLEAKMANMEGNAEITIRDLIKASLRMRPTRIVVGEVRGEEAVDLLQACNTGHEGSMSTLHANSTKDMASRLEMMVLMGMSLPLDAIRRQIAAGFDIFIHLGRMRDKSRKVMEITEVTGYENGEIMLAPLYRWREGKGLVKEGILKHTEKLVRAGVSYEDRL